MSHKPPNSDPQSGVRVAPPPARDEPMPEPRAGYVWVPGFWDWGNGRHVWMVGHWIAERRGYHWQRNRWIMREGRWYLQTGGWTADDDEPGTARQAETRAR